jgi:pyruvate/2-oxoglutarate dehydrogenase complex dihydrolipoamide dehydrogenase (E3) component
MTEHDVVVIGAGPTGEVCAGKLADEGLDVALVERELVGGECAFWSCMPSKALLRPAQLLAEVSRVPGAKQAVTGKLDAAATLARRTEVIHDLDDSVKLPWLQDHGITLHRGPARLDGVRRVRVGDELLTARRAVVIAVGSGAVIPPIPGLRELAPWTNRQGTTAARVPGRLTVLGGGVVGCELAQAWSSLGATVTLVEAQPRLLSNEEPFAAEQLAQALRDLGVDVRLGAQVTAASRTKTGSDDGVISLTLDGGDVIDGDELLVAVGRRPHTGDLGLETVDLEPGATISVDDRMRVTTPAHRDWLYAVGDVNGRALLTHAGKYQAMIASANIMNREAAAVWDGELSPRVAFTEPQIAAVGRTLQQALRDGITARAVDADPGATAGASFVGKGAPSGARIVVDQAREVIVGATFTGPDVADMLHAATVAIVGEVPLRRLVHAIPSFPTRGEVWLKLLEDWQP